VSLDVAMNHIVNMPSKDLKEFIDRGWIIQRIGEGIHLFETAYNAACNHFTMLNFDSNNKTLLRGSLERAETYYPIQYVEENCKFTYTARTAL
jgi:hypothetical protein